MSAYVNFALGRILDSGNIEGERLYYSSNSYVYNQVKNNTSLKPNERAQLLLAPVTEKKN